MSAARTSPAAKRPAGTGLRAKSPASRPATRKAWVPERQDLIWIECNPQAGSEMRDLQPMLVLSPGAFNARTGQVIGLPMTTAPYNATNPFALAVGAAGGRGAGKTSYVLCHQPKSFDWRARGAKPYAKRKLADAVFAKACAVLNQIISIE